MYPKSPKWLDQIRQACKLVLDDTSGRTLADYEDELLRWAGIRYQIQLVGEALNRIKIHDLDTAERVTDYQKIIGLRNRIAHEYDTLDDVQVWAIIQNWLPLLKNEVEALLTEADG